MMSQWGHSTWDLGSPEAAPAAQRSNPCRTELEVGAPVLCIRLLFSLGPRDTGHEWQEHTGDLCSSGSGDSILES